MIKRLAIIGLVIGGFVFAVLALGTRTLDVTQWWPWILYWATT